MKKSIIALLVGASIVSTTQAASVLWEVANGSVRNFTVANDTVTEASAFLSGASLYLFLGTTTTEDVGAAFTNEGFDSSLLTGATLLDGTASTSAAGGKAAGSTPVTNNAISSSQANDFFLVVATQKDGDYYYKLVTASQTGYDTAKDPPDAPTTVSFARNAVQAVSWTPAASAVPEPATGALALAGIALLFKRRRA